jgi:cytidyltransferase-like protein
MSKLVAVSGGFDPIHIGHVRMIREARALGDELVVILNNDNWLMAKKGFVFMPEAERQEIIEALEGVSKVVLTKHVENDPDRSVCEALREIHPDIFANGGDRLQIIFRKPCSLANLISNLFLELDVEEKCSRVHG